MKVYSRLELPVVPQSDIDVARMAEINELYRLLSYNAILPMDYTVRPAPPGLPRSHSWHVDMVGDLQGDYDYRRFFYLTEHDARADNEAVAVAAWVIDGQAVFFEYYDNGVLTEIISITNPDGTVILPTFRPIRDQATTWFFGANRGTAAFPDADNIRSIIDYNIPTIVALLGETINLPTNSKQIVGALTEIHGMIREGEQVKIADSKAELDLMGGNMGDIGICPEGIFAQRIVVRRRGFTIETTPDSQFVGAWYAMGENPWGGTVNGQSLGSHYYLHESGAFVMVWSNYNANPNVPRTGYAVVNSINTPRNDAPNALLSKMTSGVIDWDNPSSIYNTLSGTWAGNAGTFTTDIDYFQETEPSQLGWELLFAFHIDDEGRPMFNDTPLATQDYVNEQVVTAGGEPLSILSPTEPTEQAVNATWLQVLP